MKIENQVQVSLYHDIRRAKKDGTFPVKIYVWDVLTKEGKYYSSNISCTLKEFKAGWESSKPRKEFRELRDKLKRTVSSVETVVIEIPSFSFSTLEKRMGRGKNMGRDVFYHFTEIICKFKDGEQLKTASGYEMSQKSLKDYMRYKGQNPERLIFSVIDVTWLDDYQKFMTSIKTKGKAGKTLSLTTVSMYLRNLRAVFNKAIKEQEIQKDIYPFGLKRDGKYQMPAPRKVKKALSKKALAILFKVEVQNELQQKARDFFFFSYVCNGMNIKDIALLQQSQLDDNGFTFFRAKVKNTNAAPVEIRVYKTEHSQFVIDTYGNKSGTSEYVFPIIDEAMTATKRRRSIENFTSFVNQHLKKLCRANGLSDQISTYWARHSFITIGSQAGKGDDFLQKAVGHSKPESTRLYIDSLDNDTDKEFSNSLMDF